MADQTFTPGQILTQQQMATLQSNSGLIPINTGVTVSSTAGTPATVSNGLVTVGTSNTSVTVSGCFSTTFDHYRIVVANVNATNADWFRMALSGSSGVSYGYGTTYYAYGATIASDTSAGNSFWRQGIMGSTTAIVMDIQNPFLSVVTTQQFSSTTNGYACFGGGYNSNTTSSTGFTLTPSSGTVTGGTITVFGYRKI